MSRKSLQVGDMVAFRTQPKSDMQDSEWILAKIIVCPNGEDNLYQIQDVEPNEVGSYELISVADADKIVILPRPYDADSDGPADLSDHPERISPVGSAVLALYPDANRFYRAEVLATPAEMNGEKYPYRKIPLYDVCFEDEDYPTIVQARWVVEWPNGPED